MVVIGDLPQVPSDVLGCVGKFDTLTSVLSLNDGLGPELFTLFMLTVAS
jgi:hypothetical protein